MIIRDKIAQNVNGDEAAVLGIQIIYIYIYCIFVLFICILSNFIGAGFKGAELSHQFKVKEIKIKDITPYPIEATNKSDVDNVDVKPLGEKEKFDSIQRYVHILYIIFSNRKK